MGAKLHAFLAPSFVKRFLFFFKIYLQRFALHHHYIITFTPLSLSLSLSLHHYLQWEDHLVVINQTSRGAFGLLRRMQKYLHTYPTLGLEIGPWFPRKQVLFGLFLFFLFKISLFVLGRLICIVCLHELIYRTQ